MLWPFKPDKRWIAPILIGAGLLVAGFFIWLRMQPEEVQVYRLVRRDVVATLTVTGEVKARETIAISPMVSARIESVAVDEGDRVLRGQVLVTLDSNDTRASLREAQARVAEAQASVDVLRQGSRQEEIARLQAQVSEIQAQVQRSQAAVAGAQAEQAEAQTYANRLRQLFQTGAVNADTEWLMIDSTMLRAHQCAAGAKKAPVRKAGEQCFIPPTANRKEPREI